MGFGGRQHPTTEATPITRGDGGNGSQVRRRFFWKWSAKYAEEVWDGQPHFLHNNLEELTPYTAPQARSKTDKELQLVRAKIILVRKREYIAAELVDSILHYFYVPKGLNDLWIVYNGIGYGLNNVICLPHFGLPYVSHTLRGLMPGYYQCDLNIGEMFLDYLLHDNL